ncbi:hypothetical protein PO909_028658 [Leuciscus waleckii]
MAVFYDLRLVSLAVLMLVSQLDSASAAVRVFGLYARDLTGDPFGNFPDPYVKVWCGSSFGGQTEFHKDNNRPTWSAQFNFPDCKPYENLELEVWDKDLIIDDHLGTCGRQVKNGTFSMTCHLDSGSLFYKYELKQ